MHKIVFPDQKQVEVMAQRAFDREWAAAYRVYKKAIEPCWLEFQERCARAKKRYDEEVGK